jgi:hypothetical protein
MRHRASLGFVVGRGRTLCLFHFVTGVDESDETIGDEAGSLGDVVLVADGQAALGAGRHQQQRPAMLVLLHAVDDAEHRG